MSRLSRSSEVTVVAARPLDLLSVVHANFPNYCSTVKKQNSNKANICNISLAPEHNKYREIF